MAEGDTFGSGLDPSTMSFGANPAAPEAAPVAAPSALQPSQQASQTLLFGSGLSFGQPRYVPPDPQATETAQAADLVQQRIRRANDIANNPLAAIFNPEAVQAARDFVSGEGAAKLQALRTQQQQQTDIQKSAANFGIPKAETNPYMTNDTIDNALLDKYKSGDFSAANALKARGKGEWVQDFAGAALDGAGARLKAAETAATKLSAANGSQAAYVAARRSLTPEDQQALVSMGVTTIPDKASDWVALAQQHGAKFAQALQQQSQLAQRYNNMTNFDATVPKDQEAALQGDVRLGSTNEPAGFPVRTRAIDGQPGHVGPQKSAMTENYGLSPKNGGWSAWSPEREKSFQAVLNQEDVKGAVNQYNIANKFRHEAHDEKNYNSSAGLALLKDTLGGVGRDVAEKSAAAGTTGLTQMMTKQQGGFEGWMNRAQNEIGAFKNWLDKGQKGDAPRVSADTKRGLQLVAETNYQYALEQAKGRLGGAMTYAGQGGKPLDQIPLDADLKKDLAPAHEEGRQDAINGYRALPSVVRGDQRIFFTPGANVPGAIPPRGPLTPSTQQGTNPPVGDRQPAASPGPNPSSSGHTQPPPTGSGPGAPAAPVTIAGQQVNVPLPPGASPNFVPNLQRIESGNERSPWTAGTKGSSASGAFQFINSTWAADKPQGAPDRAGDATPEQQAQALATHTAKNAASLQGAGLPVNDTNLYIAHNLGAGGALSLLKADPKADARTVVGEAAAKNNPTFFRGRPTVATALARYEGAMNGTLDAKAGASSTFDSRLSQLMPGLRRSQTANDLAANAVDYAPAIGGTAGAVVGGAAGGIPGAMVGGAAGSAAGNRFRNAVQGNEQSLGQDAKQAALGLVLGIVPEGRPLAGAALRAAGVGGVEAGAEALQGGDAADIAAAGAKGVGFALAGEALGRFVSSAGATAYKALSRYTQTAQAELSAQAGKLADARKALETEQPKLPGEGSGANPKYEAAKKAADDATAAIKDHGQNPDDMVHAYEQAKAGVSAGEAAVTRKAASEKRDVGAGYDQLRTDAREAGVGAPKPNQAVPDGPAAQLRTPENPTGKVPAQFKPEADHAEMLIKAPAKDWGEKWQQLQDAGSELIQKRMAFLQAGDKPSADAMDALFKGVRNQQEAAAKYVFGEKEGAKAIAKLEGLDTRYAKIMNATQGMNYEKMRGVLAQGNTPAARELEKNFREFAKDDPGAIRAFNAMKAGARGDWKSEAALMGPVIMGEVAANLHGIPTVGAISALVGAQRLYKLVQGYMNAKVLGKAVMFKDFLAQEIRKPEFHSAAQRAVVQGVAQ